MSDKVIYVHVDWEGKTYFVGRLYARDRKGRESATFDYDRSWLQNPSHFALEPALSLHQASFHTHQGRALFGSILDSAPDRWGRMLIRRSERIQAKIGHRDPHTLGEVDFLLRVDDETRQGALRFSESESGPFLADQPEGKRIPLLVDLPRLLSATDRVVRDDDNDEDMRLLLAPGSSLGGARPKASVRDKHGALLIAKFPHHADEIDLPLWEGLSLTLAQRAGLNVTRHRIEKILGQNVILVNRFDRDENKRIPFISAMSLLGANDNDEHNYLEIADALRRHSGNPLDDLVELWKRVVFSILVSNTDDHLRNHGLLLPDLKGWRLSPAYDINPTPIDIKPRRLTTWIVEDDNRASLELAYSVSERFHLHINEAKEIAKQMGSVTAKWRELGQFMGIKPIDLDRMSSAFEHQDLRLAIS